MKNNRYSTTLLPACECSFALAFEFVSSVKVSQSVEVIPDRRINGCEFLQTSSFSRPLHRSFLSVASVETVFTQ